MGEGGREVGEREERSTNHYFLPQLQPTHRADYSKTTGN